MDWQEQFMSDYTELLDEYEIKYLNFNFNYSYIDSRIQLEDDEDDENDEEQDKIADSL